MDANLSSFMRVYEALVTRQKKLQAFQGFPGAEMLENSKKGRGQTSPATRESSYRTKAIPDVSSLDDVGDEPATGGSLFKQRRLNRGSLAYWCQDEDDEEIVPAGRTNGAT